MNLCKSKYVIFDFDGVIVDSEKVYFKCWRDASLFYGYNLSNDQLLSLRSCDKSIAYKLFGSIEKYNLVREKRKEIMDNYLIDNKFELKPGILECFKALKSKGYIIVIATSSSLKIVNFYLDYYKLNKYVNYVISAKSLTRGKPYPDIYLYVCSHFNINPCDALAIEDSPNGILSAFNANVNVVMIPDLTNITDDLKKYVALVCNNAFDLINYL